MKNLWSENTPNRFWQSQPRHSEEAWETAVKLALPVLQLPDQIADIDSILLYTLGEMQFGSSRWQLSNLKHWYYNLKPLLPRIIINLLKNINSLTAARSFPLAWPSELRYIHFQWEIVKQLLNVLGQDAISIRNFWPSGKRFAFVLTHDIETEKGLSYVREVADLEESFGFRSSFNFVPERYPQDEGLLQELRQRGFEVGVHGLRHDGKLYLSQSEFLRRADRINYHLDQFGAVGFRSPFMHRNPEWLQALKIEYDLSFFDTDPYEPLPGGCMSIWPYRIGRFIELPYTLCQDSTMSYVLGTSSPIKWLEKLNMIELNHGMALLNSHPDYLSDPNVMRMYHGLLAAVANKEDYWHALPVEVARWWRRRDETQHGSETDEMTMQRVRLNSGNHDLVFEPSPLKGGGEPMRSVNADLR